MGLEAFDITKQKEAFGDVTRWLKDSFGTLRGLLFIVFVIAGIFGLCYFGVRVTNAIFPKKETPLIQSVTNSGAGAQDVKVQKIEKQKNSILGLF